MISLAFKRGSGGLSDVIKARTGGEFSHVELWLGGPQSAAMCYSSREPVGTGFATLDLTDAAIWKIVPIPATADQERNAYWFCLGDSGRPYDFIGLAGIGTDQVHLRNTSARFCSNCCAHVMQQCLGMLPGVDPWLIAPSGFDGPGNRHGLYELVTGAEKA